MIIAIDESGDFAVYSARYNYFVAVLISQQNESLPVKEAQFEEWKKSIPPEKFDKSHEVKGTDLTEEELLRFTKEVLLAEPTIYPITVRIKPNENKEELKDKFQAIELEAIDKSIVYLRESEQIDRVEFYQKFRRWYEKRNFQHYMKLGMLEHTIGKSLKHAIGISIAEWAKSGSDEDLMNISIMIDQDFVTSPTERTYFDEILRQAIRHITQKHPLPIAREMIEAAHPFVTKYQVKGDRINLAELLGDKMNFLSSSENWPLQIADIYSTIIQRVENKETCQDSMKLVEDRFKKLRRTHFKMNTDPETETRIEVERGPAS
jgi:Protein of unknown function (DUF3800)